MAELEDAPWASEGASDLPDAPWAAAAPSRESSAPEWVKSVGSGAGKVLRAFPMSAPLTAPLAALPETYDVAAEGIKSLGEPANPFTHEREAIKREAMKSGPLLSGASGEEANRIADRQIANRRRQEALGTPLKALSVLASPLQGMLRHYGSQPLEDVGGPPKEVTEGFAGIGAAAAGLRPGMNTLRKAMGRPLEGEVLPSEGGGPRGGPAGGGGPTIEGEWTSQSPMTPREGTNARLLPHDYQGSGTAGDPHFDAAWESLGSRGSMGAAGRPGGPLADIHPEAIQTMRDIVREEGLSPWELERRQEEERSPHHFGGEWSDAMRNELRGLNSLGGEGANIIGQSVRARRRDAPERIRGYFQDFFGERLDPREEVAKRKQADKEAQPFWREFDATPIPPTSELMAIEDALKSIGAWAGAEKWLRAERVPRENHFVELPNTGEHVLANPELPSETIRVPTAKFYQAAKEHLDGQIERAMAAPGGTNQVRILVGLKNALTEAIDRHPDPTVAGVWKSARDVSAGPRQWESAIALGKRAMSEHVDPGDFAMLWDTLSDQQKLGVRKGAHELLGGMLGRKGSADINTVKHVLGDNNQQKLRTMQEAEGAADRMISNVEHEQGMAQGPLTGPNTADKLAAQQRYKPKETWAQTVKMEDLPKGVTHGALMGGKKLWQAKQAKMIEEAQKKQNLINADIARLMTLQGPEWNAVVRYLHGVASEEPSPGAGPRPSPRPAPVRPVSEVEPPPHSQVPEGPPGYLQPDMTVVEATKVLRDAGYPQADINRFPGPTRVQTAQHLLDEQREAARNPFPGDASRAPERVDLAATSYKGKVYTGQLHSDAVGKIIKETGMTEQQFEREHKNMTHGFVTSGGRFLERDEAAKLTGGTKPIHGDATYLVKEKPLVNAEKPLSLLEWIRKQGGIDPNDPLAGDVRAMFGNKNPGGIIRKGGRRLDQLREGAVGEKYFLDQGDIEGREASTDVNTLLDAMVREADGQKQYPLGADMRNVRNKDMEARSQEQQRELEFSPEARRLDRELGQYGMTRGMMPAGTRERAIEMLRSGVETDAVEAFERAVSEQRQAEAQGEHAAEAGEGLEPSPQSGGMAARGKRAAGEGQPRNGADMRDTGARDREETEPLRRGVIERGRSGRPIETKPLAVGKENDILDVGRKKVQDSQPATFYHGTTAKNLPGILKNGLKTGKARNEMSDASQVYLTDNVKSGHNWAQHATKYGGDPVVLELRVPKNKMENVSEDRSPSQWHKYRDTFKHEGDIPREWIVGHYKPKALYENHEFAGYDFGDLIPARNRATGGRVDPSAINSNPTEAQKEAGNYAKDHVRVHGLDITIENAKGSKRSGVDKGGKKWSVSMPAAYGYIKKTEGADGDHVDVYLGPHLKSRHVFVVDQLNAETGKFDEHKCLLAFASAKQARNCYLKAFSDGKGKARLGAMHEADIDGFKTWLAAGDTTKPIGKIAA